jgi:hypothetical protein
MDRPGDEFFSRSGFTKDEYSAVGWGHPADQSEHFLHGLAFAEDIAAVVGTTDLFLQVDLFFFQLLLPAGGVEVTGDQPVGDDIGYGDGQLMRDMFYDTELFLPDVLSFHQADGRDPDHICSDLQGH